MAGDVFIAWIRFQRRAESMQSHFGYSLHYIPSPYSRTWQKPFGYLIQFWRTWQIIRRERPATVWVQMPPTFVVHLVYLIRLLSGQKFAIIADCHNRVFRAPWSRIPGLVWMLNVCNSVLAHNAEVYQTALEMGVSRQRLVLLETRPAQLVPPAGQLARPDIPEILVPCSFNPDEPIEALLEAARQAPDLRFLITGNIEKARAKGFVDGAPDNAVFTGFLSKADYEKHLFTCSAVLGLTSLEGIQLSVANEAVGASKAMVLSDTQILRELFGTAALFTQNDPGSLVASCRHAVATASELDERAKALLSVRELRWQGQAKAVVV